jgi:hypothetical protein
MLASGLGIPSIAGTFSGTRVAQVIGGNLVFSDFGASPIGIYGCTGLPTAPSTASLLITEPSSPMDFAVSPDGMTVYISDNATFVNNTTQAGGIQRYDGTPPSSYTYTYTLGTGAGSTVGARGLTVDWSSFTGEGAAGTGAKLFATTAELSGNRLIKIVDTGAASAATLIATAGASQALAGVRFGPAIIQPSFAAQPQDESAIAGPNSIATLSAGGVTNIVRLSAGAIGSGPLTYKWYFQAGGVGPFVAIPGATSATYTINTAVGKVGNYYVVVTNPGGLTATSATVSFSILPSPQFAPSTYPAPGGGLQLNFTGPAGYPYTIWTATDVTLSPIESTWTSLTTGTFSGGADTYTDPNGGADLQQYYIISVP